MCLHFVVFFLCGRWITLGMLLEWHFSWHHSLSLVLGWTRKNTKCVNWHLIQEKSKAGITNSNVQLVLIKWNTSLLYWDVSPFVMSLCSGYGYATLANIIVCLMSVFGIVVLLFSVCTRVFESCIQFCISLAVGSLTGDALLHLIPSVSQPPALRRESTAWKLKTNICTCSF